MNPETCPICGEKEAGRRDLGYHLVNLHGQLLRETFAGRDSFDPADREPEHRREGEDRALEYIELAGDDDGATTEEILEYGGEYTRDDFLEYDLERLAEQGRIERTADGWEVLDS